MAWNAGPGKAYAALVAGREGETEWKLPEGSK